MSIIHIQTGWRLYRMSSNGTTMTEYISRQPPAVLLASSILPFTKQTPFSYRPFQKQYTMPNLFSKSSAAQFPGNNFSEQKILLYLKHTKKLYQAENKFKKRLEWAKHIKWMTNRTASNAAVGEDAALSAEAKKDFKTLYEATGRNAADVDKEKPYWGGSKHVLDWETDML